MGSPEFAATLTEALNREPSLSAFYRVVNKEDIVARLPRSSRINRLVQYEHVGRTVLVDDLAAENQIWVEGVSEGICPLQDLSPFSATNKAQLSQGENWMAFDRNSTAVLDNNIDRVADVLRDSLGDAAPVKLLSSVNSTRAVIANSSDTSTVSGSWFFDSIFKGIESADLSGLYGVDVEEIRTAVEAFIADIAGGIDEGFIERELAILRSIVDGRALDHHLEPSYFLALKKVVLSQSESDDALTL